MKKILCMLVLILTVICVFASCDFIKAPEITISDDGYWVINGEKTDVKAQGEKGEKGDKGDNGDGATATNENPLGLAFFLKDDGTYAVEIGQAKYLSKIEIPATYKGKAVTEVGVFGNGGGIGVANSVLKEITIPNSVTSIGNFAFDFCTSLTSVTIPDSVTSIGERAFAGCYSLTSVTIPDSVTSIGYCAFYECTSLTSVTIGDSVTSIGDFAFDFCTSLTSVTIGDSVTSIGNNAFYSCTSLTSVTFANPNGWWYASSAGATSGTDISAKSLADPATAAQSLKYYRSYYWFRTE